MNARHSSVLLLLVLGAAWGGFPAARPAQAADLTVCPAGPPTCGYSTVQAAVDAAASGDTIKVAAGTYTGVSAHGSHVQVVYIGKRITIRGGYTTAFAEPPDPAAHPTTLDAQGQGHVVYIPYLGSYAVVTLEGLRLTGGYASEAVAGDDTGGGIRADGTSGDRVVVRDCWIGGNSAAEGGAGGIAFDFSELELIDSTVISNTGTGVILWQSDSPLISGSAIAGNSAGGVSILSAEYGDGLDIQGNAFTGNAGNAIYLNTIDSDGGNDVIAGNTFDGNDRGLFAGSVYGTILQIHGNTFHGNTNNNNCFTSWDIYGAGVWLQGANAEVLHNTFAENYACYGGGISVSNGGGNAVLIQGNAFLSNTAGMGGAIYLDGDGNAAAIEGNLISGNQAHDGGGLAIDVGAQPTVRRNVLTGNQVPGYGGALYCGSCTVTLERNRITDNSAGSGGGLAFGWPAFLIPQTVSNLANNLIADNSAPTGSGVAVQSSNLVLVHNTIVHNLGGAGVYVAQDLPTSVVLTNTIVASHSVGIQVAGGSAAMEGTLWGDGVWANGSDWAGSGIVTGTVNLWGDPRFVDPAGGDYHIAPDSDAVDQGVAAGVANDIDGDHRPNGAGPDIGADERAWRVYLPVVVK